MYYYYAEELTVSQNPRGRLVAFLEFTLPLTLWQLIQRPVPESELDKKVNA